MSLQIEALDVQETPISTADGIAYTIIALEVGIIAGMLIT